MTRVLKTVDSSAQKFPKRGLLVFSIVVTLFVATLREGVNGFTFVLVALSVLVAFFLLYTGLAMANHWTGRNDFFAPIVAFPVGYVLWFLIGSIDFVRVPSSVSFGLFEPIPSSIWFYVAAGLIAYFLGVRFAGPVQITFKQSGTDRRPRWMRDRFWQVISALFALMLISYIYIVQQIGIPILSPAAGEIRLEMSSHGVMQAILFSSAWTIILFLLIYLWSYTHTRAAGIACWVGIVIASALLLSLGGRSQLFVPVLTAIVLHHYLKARFRLANLAAACLVLFCFIGAFGYFRDTALMGVNHAEEWLKVPSYVVPFVYAYLYVRYPVATFRDLTELIPKSVRYQYGSLTFGPLDTLLAGHHQQSDMFFKQILGNDFIGAGQPATLLGPLYGDGGTLGVVLGMVLFGALVAGTYRWMLTNPTIFRILIYAWIVQTAIFSYFANLFPYLNTLWMPLMWLMLDRVMTPARSSPVVAESLIEGRA